MGIFDRKPNTEKLKEKRDVEGLIKALEHRDETVQEEAAVALGDIGESGVEPLIQVLKDGYLPTQRATAVKALDKIGWEPKNDTEKAYYLITKDRWDEVVKIGEPAVEPLIQALKYNFLDWPVRRAAATALGGIRDERAVEPLIWALKHQHYEVRATAAKALAEIGDERAVEPLVQVLKDQNIEVREAAEEALAKIKGKYPEVKDVSISKEEEPKKKIPSRADVRRLAAKKDLEGLIEALGYGDEFSGSDAADALGEMGDARAVEPLIQALQDNNNQPVLRNSAALALGEISDLRAVEPLIQAFYKDPDVRWNAGEAVGKMGELGVKPLIQALKNKDSDIREEAAKALGRTGDAGAIEPIIKALEDEDEDVGREAAGALVEIGEPAVEPLIQALKHKDSGVRGNAAWALGRIKDARAVEPLIQVLKGKNSDVRYWAIYALEEIGDAQAIEPLVQVLKDKNEDSKIREEAKEAIEELQKDRKEKISL